MAYNDLRDYLEQLDKIGELRYLDGVDWNLEVGAVSEMSRYTLLFDNLVGYPPGYRILSNMGRSVTSWLLAMGWDTSARGNDLAREYKNRLLDFKPIPPRWVGDGPVTENVQEGKDVNLLKFPVPKLHHEDGGRYIGTADAMITKDMETGNINMSVHRMQVHDKSSLGFHLPQGRHAAHNMRGYHRQGKPCPVVILVGTDPRIHLAAVHSLVNMDSTGELGFAGWVKREPIDVIRGEFTDLPIPASAEIAIEGEIVPGESKLEGPFGEWTGYSEPREAPIIRVKRVLHRNEPILTVISPSGPSRHPQRGGLRAEPRFSAVLWEQMERAGARGVVGVAMYAVRFLVVVSIKNEYAGQARQVGHLAQQCHAGVYMGRYVIVVDEDIDPYNLDQVMWAVARRSDPQRDIDIVRYCESDSMDSALPYEERKATIISTPVYNSRCVIDACRPVEWDPNIKKSIVYSPELQAKVREKWRGIVFP